MKRPLFPLQMGQLLLRWPLARVLPYILLSGGFIGFASAAILSYDKLQILKNPHFISSCNLNPVLSCGSVMTSRQADLFGFPNSWIGLVGFGLVIGVGMALLAGGQFKRWFWLIFKLGLDLAMVFAYWLLLQSIFVIGALCPFCLSVDIVLTVIFWYATLHLITTKVLPVPRPLQPVVGFSQRYHLELLISWFVVIIALVLHHFWYYYGQFL